MTASQEMSAVRQFLNFAVVVDDRALDSPSDASELEVPEELLDLGAFPDESQAVASDDTTGLRTRELTDAFADLSIGCAVLAPAEASPETRSRVQRLAARADILILDWVLRQPASEDSSSGPGHERTSLGLIQDLLKEDADSGGRMRLLCIYTGSSSIESILDQVEQVLASHRADHASFGDFKVDRETRVIRAANLSILLLLKPTNPLADELPTTSEEALPAVLVAAFADLAGDGLLPRLALAAVSAVRTHTHRLVARFPADLDPAFLSHRALTSPYEAEQYALGLIGDEIAALLTATRVEATVHERPVRNRLAQLIPKAVATCTAKASVDISREEAIRLLALGHEAASPIKRTDGGDLSVKNLASVTSLMLGNQTDFSAARGRDERFGVLSCLSRSPEHEGRKLPPPLMTLGAVMRSKLPQGKGTPWQYWICLQPACDSVRLPAGRDLPFPLFPLDVHTPETKCDLLVQEPDAASVTHLALRTNTASGKRSIVDLQSFDFGASTQGVVGATWHKGPSAWHFRSANGKVFQWLGDLRVEQAHQLVSELATAFSRAGLDESHYRRKHG